MWWLEPITIHVVLKYHFFKIFSWNSEAFASEFQENLEEIVSCYTDNGNWVINKLTISRMQRVTQQQQLCETGHVTYNVTVTFVT